MILPTKVLKPIDSLYCISAFVVELMLKHKQGISFENLHEELNHSYPKVVSIEKLTQCLDFLFIIGRVRLDDETLKVVL